ncbi:MAG: NUDIX hydrolase [Flavobacteriia bacterium]|nr:NUDIX hydrolase [Flavobacteriia bacterium]
MISSNKKYTAAGIAVKFGDLVLLGRRSSVCENFAGYWSIPCGTIEEQETPDSAARREFFEETGILAKKELRFVGDFKIDSNKYFCLFSFEVKNLIFPSSLAKDSFEHDEWGFFKIGIKTLPNPISSELSNLIIKLK